MHLPTLPTRALAIAASSVAMLSASSAIAAGKGPSCLLIGDSTIVGSAGELQRLIGRDCVVSAKVGASTAAIGGWSQASARYGVAFIGAGSNDADSPALRQRLERLRANVNAARVVWLAPYNRRARGLVEQVATQSGDATVPLASFASPDGIHPASYKQVARALWSGDAPAAVPRAASRPPSRPVRMARAVTPVPRKAAQQKVLPVAHRDPRLDLAMVARPSIARPVLMRPTITRPAIALPAPAAQD